MNLYKTTILNGVAVFIKMATLLVVNKVLALYVGPSGYALFGQFQNFVQMLVTLSSGAISNGVTKYIAESGSDTKQTSEILSTSLIVSLVGSLVSSFLIICFSKELSILLLKSSDLQSVMTVFAISLPFAVLNLLMLATMNGKKEIEKLVIANVLGSLLSVAVTFLLSVEYGIFGALISLALFQALSFIITIVVFMKCKWFYFRLLALDFNKDVFLKLSLFIAMTLVSAICVPATQVLIRSTLGNQLGWESAGYWEAITRLSSAYLLFFTTTLSVYFLPRFAELTSERELTAEIYSGLKLIIPSVSISCIIIYVFRFQIIDVLFSNDFVQMQTLFKWQLVGDFFKVCSWLIAFLMISHARVKAYIIIELFFSFTLYFSVVFLVKFYGLESAAIAHAVNYFVYMVVVSVYIKFYLRNLK